MKTLLDIIHSGTSWLTSKGVDDARLNMQLLLCKLLDCSKIELYTRFDEVLPESILSPLREKMNRRGSGEPLQHILGEIEFYNSSFICDKRALIPRPETEELVEIILNNFSSSKTIIDIGTGSGVIGISLSLKIPDSEVICLDISNDALSLARENAASLSANVSFLESDLLSNHSGLVDLIVSNPPYIPHSDKPSLQKELDYDPEIALFSDDDGLQHIHRIISESAKHLTDKGHIALEIGINQATVVSQFLNTQNFTNIHTYKDLSGIERFVTAQWTN